MGIPLPITYYPLPITHDLLPITNYPLLITYENTIFAAVLKKEGFSIQYSIKNITQYESI